MTRGDSEVKTHLHRSAPKSEGGVYGMFGVPCASPVTVGGSPSADRRFERSEQGGGEGYIEREEGRRRERRPMGRSWPRESGYARARWTRIEKNETGVGKNGVE